VCLFQRVTYRLEGPGSNSSRREQLFSSTNFQTCTGLTKPPIQWIPASLPRFKAAVA